MGGLEGGGVLMQMSAFVCLCLCLCADDGGEVLRGDSVDGVE